MQYKKVIACKKDDAVLRINNVDSNEMHPKRVCHHYT